MTLVPHLRIEDIRIEYRWWDPAAQAYPVPIVLLHEGLGSVSLWKEFPQQLADTTGRRVLAYSRYGYGQSTPLRSKRDPRYMHDEALQTLPALRSQLGIDDCILFGHSDGASIGLIHAGARRWRVSALIVLAPHVFVEEEGVRSIAAARDAYFTSDLKERLAKRHADPDSAFWGWCDIWLDARFRDWNIEEYLAPIACPVLAIQGHDDEYGTMEQITRLVRAVDLIEVEKLHECGHSPHRDQPARVLERTQRFLSEQFPDPAT